MLSQSICLAEENMLNEDMVRTADNVILSAKPEDYDEMSGVWKTGGLKTKFIQNGGDYPVRGEFTNSNGEKMYTVDLGGKAGFYAETDDSADFYAGMWVRLGALDREKNTTLFSVENGDTVYHRASLFYDRQNSKITAKYNNGTTVCAEADLTEYANGWVYLGFGRKIQSQQAVLTIYLNGNLKSSGTSTNTSISASKVNLFIGTSNMIGYYGLESLGEVEVLDVIPDDTQILKNYMDNSIKYEAKEQTDKIFELGITGGEVEDLAGQAVTEVLNGTSVGTYTYTDRIAETALILPEGGYLKAEGEKIVSGNEMSWELWFSCDTETNGTIFSMGDINNPEAHAILRDGTIIFRAGRYDDETYVSSSVCQLESNKLYHLVLSRRYFENDGIGHFEYSAYCNSVLLDGFPYVRRGAFPKGQKTAMYVGGASMVITGFNVYDEFLAQDNIREMYLKGAKPISITPANGKEEVSINTESVVLEYDLPVTKEASILQNITLRKNGDYVETDIICEGNEIICIPTDGLSFGSEYSVYSNDKKLAQFTTTDKSTSVKYLYDFENPEKDPVLKFLSGNSNVAIENNPITGSRALKVQSGWVAFSFDLPEAVDNRYILLRTKATITEKGSNATVTTTSTPTFNDSDGKNAVRYKYYADAQVCYGYGDYNGSYGTLNIAPPVTDSTISAGRVDSFETIIDLEEQTFDIYQTEANGTVTVYENKPLINKIKDIKTIAFELATSETFTVYYDDIEVMGFDDYSALFPPSYKVTGITCEENPITSLKEAAGKTIDIAVEQIGDFVIMGAIYDGSTLLSTQMCENGIISINVPDNADMVKLFAWKNMTDITPLFDVQPLFEN